MSGIQAELQESVKELAKAKKKYYDCEQVAHAVREKADIEAKWVHHSAVHVCVGRDVRKNKNAMIKQMVSIVRKNTIKKTKLVNLTESVYVCVSLVCVRES